MPRISEYEKNLLANSYAIIQIGSSNYQVSLSDLLGTSLASSRTIGTYVNDMLEDFANMISTGFHIYPWMESLIGAGSISNAQSEENHPGIARISQVGANTGGSLWLGNAANILIAGQEETEFIVRPAVLTTAVYQFGFLDSFTAVGAASDGVYFQFQGAQIIGVTLSSGVSSTTATNYVPSINTWYRLKLVINSNATRVDFYIYDESGNLLWTDNLTTNIPTTAGRVTSHGLRCYNTGAATRTLVDVDYMSLFVPRLLTR